jgi:hypothetical protein
LCTVWRVKDSNLRSFRDGFTVRPISAKFFQSAALTQSLCAISADPLERSSGKRSFTSLVSSVFIRVDVAKVSAERVQELVEHAWRNKAPRRVVAAYDAQ